MERNRGGRPRHPDVLTPAEWRVLHALREGGTNAEIASRLGLSPDTVKYHISNMLAKLELRDRRALATWRPEGRREGLGALFALPAALWSLARPLAWVGVGAAGLAGVVVVVVALVALEGIVERDADSPAALAPPTISTPAAPPSAPGSCATPADPTCIHALYIGAPGDYAQVADIPSAMRLNAGPGGTYHVDAGLEVTVVTAARLPSGWTRFYLEYSPLEFGTPSPVSSSQLIPPVGTTYTFTVSEEDDAPTLVTFELKRAKPFVRPRPDGKPHIGATVVETEFAVKDCSSGIAVTNPQTNTELVGDCESLLGLRDTIRGTGRLNWTAGKAMSEWMGVTVSSTPQRVTALNLADLGLDGELSGLLGNLTGLTTLNLSGNPLTGMIPSKLALLANLTTASLAGTDFEGCAPPVLHAVAATDAASLGLRECPPALNILGRTTPLSIGTYKVAFSPWLPALIFDVPGGVQLEAARIVHATYASGSFSALILRDTAGGSWIGLDLGRGEESHRYIAESGSTPASTEAAAADIATLLNKVADSAWLEPAEAARDE